MQSIDFVFDIVTTLTFRVALSPKSGVEGRVRIRKKIGGAVQAVETIRLGVRMDILAARTSGDRYNT